MKLDEFEIKISVGFEGEEWLATSEAENYVTQSWAATAASAVKESVAKLLDILRMQGFV